MWFAQINEIVSPTQLTRAGIHTPVGPNRRVGWCRTSRCKGGERDAFVASIEFTPNAAASVVLTVDEVAQLQLLLDYMSAKGAFLIDFTYDDTGT